MMWRTVLGPGGLKDRLGELQGLFSDRPGEIRTNDPLGGQVVVFARNRD